jgi:two-component system CheB/CheR fusion protein
MIENSEASRNLARKHYSAPGFFQDPDVFDALKSEVLLRYLRNRLHDGPWRAWVPCCATGEEVYSFAITLSEFLAHEAVNTPLKIFGTDVNDEALRAARTGVYSETQLSGVSPVRLRRFFEKAAASYTVRKTIRDLCVLARHDVTRDAPFANIDLIYCGAALFSSGTIHPQDVLSRFHYALNAGGILLLGSCENPAALTGLFEALDRKNGIYCRTADAQRAPLALLPAETFPRGSALNGVGNNHLGGTLDVQQEADRAVLARYGPCGVVVDEKFVIVQFRGQTGSWLEPAPGSPTLDLLQMTRNGLLAGVRSALEEARSNDVPTRRESLVVNAHGKLMELDVQVLPIRAPRSGQRFFVILFEDRACTEIAVQAGPQVAAREGPIEAKNLDIERLQQDLAATRAYLRALVEEKEIANEELTVANQEILASNEELRSTNEELETAKEEIQAANEELTKSNEELQRRVLATSRLGNELANLLDCIPLPTLVVDSDLRLRRLTPSAMRVLNLSGDDVGRPIDVFKLNIDVNLRPLIQEVMDTLSMKQLELTDQAGRWIQLGIRPCTTTSPKVDGAIVTFMDIDALKRRERQLKAAYEYAVDILDTGGQPLVILSSDLHIRSANAAFYETFRMTRARSEGQRFFTAAKRQWDIPALHVLLEEMLPKEDKVENFQVEHTFAALGRRVLLVNARKMLGRDGEAHPQFLLALDDITERRTGLSGPKPNHQSIQKADTAE